MLQNYLKLSRTIHILCVGAFINRAGAFLVPFLALYFRKQFDLDVTFATSAMSVYGAGALVAALVGGHLADSMGRKSVMLLSLFGGATVLLVFSFLTSTWTLYPTIFVFSLLSEMYRPAASAMIADVTEPLERPYAFGLMYVTINLGFAVAASVGGMLAEISFKWLFWADALTAATFGAVILIWIAESHPDKVRKVDACETPPIGAPSASDGFPKNPSHPETDAPNHATPSKDASLSAAVRHILTDGVFIVFCLGTFILAVMYMQSFSTFPIYLNNLEYSPSTYGWILSINGALIVLLQIPITSTITRFHRGWAMAFAAFVTGVGFAAFGIATAPWHFALAVVVWTFGEMMGSPLSSSIVSDLAPQRFRARYMGVFTMSFSSSMMLGAYSGGELLSKVGGREFWALCGLMGVIAAVAFALIRKRLLPPAT